MPEINWIAILAATVAGFLLGGIWYGPLFSKAWIREMGGQPPQRMGKPALFAVTILLTFIAAFVFGMFLGPHPSLGLGLGAGVSAGLCWVAFSMGIAYMFAGRSFTLIAIDCGFVVVEFTLFGLIFTLLG